MNEYKITCIPAGSSDIETARITERTEAAARKRFAKIFGKTAEITGVELVNVNAIATKEQERETLEKIKEMVAELGPDSYLKTAFDGVFEDAEQNIELNAAFSMKGRLEIAEKRAAELEDDLNASHKRVTELERELANAEEISRETDTGIAELIQKDDERKEALTRICAQLNEARTSAGDAQRRAEEAEAQVVQLKAKLYDYMTATA